MVYKKGDLVQARKEFGSHGASGLRYNAVLRLTEEPTYIDSMGKTCNKKYVITEIVKTDYKYNYNHKREIYLQHFKHYEEDKIIFRKGETI